VPSGNEGCAFLCLDASESSLTHSRSSARREFGTSLSEFDGIVYILDTTDADSLSRSKGELSSLLANEAILKPILVLISKPEPSGTANEEKLVQEMGLEDAIAKVWVSFIPLSSKLQLGHSIAYRKARTLCILPI